MDTNRKVFGNKGMTTGAKLRSAVGVHRYELSPSLFRFGREYVDELSPTGIGDAFSKAVIAQHPIDVKLLNSDKTKGANQFSRLLVDKVMSSVRNAFMDTGYNLFSLVPLKRSLLHSRQFALGFSQCLFVRPEETGVSYLTASRHSGKILQPDINTYRRLGWWQRLRFILRREASIPFVILPSDGAGANLSEGLTMQLDFNITHLSQFKASIKCETELGIGETIIPIIPLEAGIARLSARFHSPEESTEGFVQPVGYILKDLGIDEFEAGMLCFKLGDVLALLKVGQRFLLLIPSISAFLQKSVIQPAALIEVGFQNFSLVFGGIQSIFKRLIHCLNYILKEGGCQANSSPA